MAETGFIDKKKSKNNVTISKEDRNSGGK